jgi:tetrapyrrole methylase family protein/MazG family protein
LDRLPPSTTALLLDPINTIIVRTLQHPAAAELAEKRAVITCDDLYQGGTFEDVYDAIARRVVEAAGSAPTIYAVPGSPLIGELAVERITGLAAVELIPGESFIEAVLAAVGYDPLDRGLRLLNGHRLPSPIMIDGPTLIAHLDLPMVLAEVTAKVARVVPEETVASVVIDAGGKDPRVIRSALERVDPGLASIRTSLFLDPEPGGLVGAVRTMARLREECPWDRRQTHQSLVKNLIEETYELVEAIGQLPDGYGALEDELGDVLLQVLFHANIARQDGYFDIEDVAENLRQKLVRRHPHVFGDVQVETPEDVKANWEEVKRDERGEEPGSVLNGIPEGMPALERATKVQRKAAEVGFDWLESGPVLDKIVEETEELRGVLRDPTLAATELGDLMFSVVNLSRHLKLDPELALRGSIARFVGRFRAMEAMGSLDGLTPEELDARWEQAKAEGRRESEDGGQS